MKTYEAELQFKGCNIESVCRKPVLGAFSNSRGVQKNSRDHERIYNKLYGGSIYQFPLPLLASSAEKITVLLRKSMQTCKC